MCLSDILFSVMAFLVPHVMAGKSGLDSDGTLCQSGGEELSPVLDQRPLYHL